MQDSKSQQSQSNKTSKKKKKRPFNKDDFETVLKAVSMPLKQKPAEKESGKT